MGFPVVTLPDLNGDGQSELALATPNAAVDGIPGAGRVHVVRSPLIRPEGGKQLEACIAICGAGGPDNDGEGLTNL